MPRPVEKCHLCMCSYANSTLSYTTQPLLNINFLYPFLENDYLSDFPLAVKHLEQKGNTGTRLSHSAAKVRVTLSIKGLL